MSAFSLDLSTARAARRLRSSPARTRSDRGRARIAPKIEAKLHDLLLQPDKPSMSAVERQLRAFCEGLGVKPIARASLYNAIERVSVPRFARRELPEAVQQALYNLGEPDGGEGSDTVPADQVVFYAFNYGSATAISFASGLPWLCLQRAERRPGWRPKSRSLLSAVMKYRGI
jgi:hypothetical protein